MEPMVYDKLQQKVVPISERTDSPIVNRSSMCYDTPFVMTDIEPYRAVAFEGAPMVTSRSQHRELLRSHGAQEVGSDMPAWMKERKYEREHGRPEDKPRR